MSARKLYGILVDGKLKLAWDGIEWTSRDGVMARNVAKAAGGTRVEVEIVIREPKPVGRGRPKGARVSPRKLKLKGL